MAISNVKYTKINNLLLNEGMFEYNTDQQMVVYIVLMQDANCGDRWEIYFDKDFAEKQYQYNLNRPNPYWIRTTLIECQDIKQSIKQSKWYLEIPKSHKVLNQQEEFAPDVEWEYEWESESE